MDKCIIYGVLDRPSTRGKLKVRLSAPMSYDRALQRHSIIDSYFWPSHCGVTAARMLLDHVCVRSVDDPHWPSEGPLCTVRRDDGTILYNGRMDRFETLSA